MSEYTQGLNPPQAKAVETIQGPLLILAGAGSGKTRVLTHRIAHMLETGVKPWHIFAVTFTNKAAGEMKERVAGLIGDVARKVWVSTFHSSCVRILRRDAEHLGYSKNFVIYDTDDQQRLLKHIVEDLKLDSKKYPVRAVRGVIDQAKNKMLSPDDLDEQGHGAVHENQCQIYRVYEKRLMAANAMDFNDLINNVVKVWRSHPNQTLAYWQDRFRYLMVDEYQDTNHAQYELIKLLAAKRRNLAVVGDDDQSIYAFRGADIRNILDFEKDFPDATVVKLEQNYRSTETILTAAMSVVKRNSQRKDKTLWTDLGKGSPIQMIVGRDETIEADKVASDLQARLRTGRSPSDVAIIYRTNARSRPFEQALLRNRIPHVLVGARKFYERREVRDMLAYLKLVVNPQDQMGLLRILNVPRRGLGKKAVETLRAHVRDNGVTALEAARALSLVGGRSAKGFARFADVMDRIRTESTRVEPGELVLYVADVTGYMAELVAEDSDEAKGRIENINELARDVARDQEEGDPDATSLEKLALFLDRATLTGQDDDLPDGDAGRVTLMTAHLAKGLEFPVVYVAGLVEGSFPLTRDEREEALEEERRLMYVALTRAKQDLVLTRSLNRINYGRGFEPCTPSRFLGEIPSELITGLGRRTPTRRTTNARGKQQALNDFLARHGGGGGAPARVPRATMPRAPIPTRPKKPAAPAEEVVTRAPESLDDFQVGVQVLHVDYGVGTIRRVRGRGPQMQITVDFPSKRGKTILPKYAKLEVVLS